METVFISGQMTGLPNYNYDEFNRVAKVLREKGFNVVNPAELGFHDTWEWQDYMKKSLIDLLTSDVDIVVMLTGWENSRGARIENYVAKSLELTVVNQENTEWLQ